MGANWGVRTAASRFRASGGRRHYNAHRQALAAQRRMRLAPMMHSHSQAQMARALNVSEATISRDVAKLNAELANLNGGIAFEMFLRRFLAGKLTGRP